MKNLYRMLALLMLLSGAMVNGFSQELKFDEARILVSQARQSLKVPKAAVSEPVKISNQAESNETKIEDNTLPEQLRNLLDEMENKKLKLVTAIHSAPKDQVGNLPPSAICADEAAVYINNTKSEKQYIAFMSRMSSEWENISLRGKGLSVAWILGVAVSKSEVKIFRVQDGKSHYRIYDSYWAKIGSLAMAASSNRVNELEVWKEGEQIFAKQKHQFSGNGVAEQSKECLFKLQ